MCLILRDKRRHLGGFGLCHTKLNKKQNYSDKRTKDFHKTTVKKR